jgi:hypothetical protein
MPLQPPFGLHQLAGEGYHNQHQSEHSDKKTGDK